MTVNKNSFLCTIECYFQPRSGKDWHSRFYENPPFYWRAVHILRTFHIMIFKRRTKNHDRSMEISAAPWQNCLAVCSKCARKVKAMDGDKSRLRVQLKALIAAKGIKKLVRPVDVSCLDVCPENKITIALFSDKGTKITNVGPGTEPSQILDYFNL